MARQQPSSLQQASPVAKSRSSDKPAPEGWPDRPTRSKQNCDLRIDACQRSRPGRGSGALEKFIYAAQHLSSLGFDIADNRVGGNAGEIGDIAVNDCLADDRLTAVLI